MTPRAEEVCGSEFLGFSFCLIYSIPVYLHQQKFSGEARLPPCPAVARYSSLPARAMSEVCWEGTAFTSSQKDQWRQWGEPPQSHPVGMRHPFPLLPGWCQKRKVGFWPQLRSNKPPPPPLPEKMAFIHSFLKYLLSATVLVGIVLGAGDTTVNKMRSCRSIPLIHGFSYPQSTMVPKQMILLLTYFQVNSSLMLSHTPHFTSSHWQFIISHHHKRKKYSTIRYFENTFT